MYTETSTLSPTRTRSRMYQAPYGVQRSIASHAPLVRTESQTTVSTALSRCSRPTADTGIIVSNTASEANACANRGVARQVLHRTGPMLPWRRRCDCRATRPRPDSRRGGAVTFNPSRRASCEGARQSCGSHAAALNEGWQLGACGQYALLEFGIFAQSVLTRCTARYPVKPPLG